MKEKFVYVCDCEWSMSLPELSKRRVHCPECNSIMILDHTEVTQEEYKTASDELKVLVGGLSHQQKLNLIEILKGWLV